jgi:F0F1-type ATP synthase membrane subunit b/b'
VVVTTLERTKTKINEYVLIIDEFKQRLTQSMQKERDRIIQSADNEAKLILRKAYQESAGLVDEAMEKIKQIKDQAKEQASRETDASLLCARKEADLIIHNAEQTIRRGAKEKSRHEVESIINQAKKDAATLADEALKTAGEEANKIIAEAKKQADLISRQLINDANKEAADINRASQELREKTAVELEQAQKQQADTIDQITAATWKAAIEEAEIQANEIIARAKYESQNERESLLAKATADAVNAAETEKEQIIQEAQQEASKIIEAARMEILNKFDESSRLMQEIQQKMQQVISTAGSEKIQVQTSNEQPAETARPSTLESAPVTRKTERKGKSGTQPRVVSEKKKSEGHQARSKINPIPANENHQTYCRRLKIEIASPVDHGQMALLEQQLMETPNLRVVMNGGSEGGAWLLVELTEPMDMLDILKKIPNIKDVAGTDDSIKVDLRTEHPEKTKS